eukprot:gnl/MRDRNA2_/MRDRNA2_123174_c0_seq1.p2 gnl/MRDRNA2_/MRDRNA2_123174_c0~~gnl/MRDRNA2_/MRDRNA2_123174_c0_seq1.p2  ORF type:complete len:129 (-),score=37.01 gnl/MRDRNA2_/MRDRNA2_123174_c0_seq1:566-952(-)
MGPTRACLTIKLSDQSMVHVNTAEQASEFIAKMIEKMSHALPPKVEVASAQAASQGNNNLSSTLNEVDKQMQVAKESEALWQEAVSSLYERLDALEAFLRDALFEHFKKIDQAISLHAASRCAHEEAH